MRFLLYLFIQFLVISASNAQLEVDEKEFRQVKNQIIVDSPNPQSTIKTYSLKDFCNSKYEFIKSFKKIGTLKDILCVYIKSHNARPIDFLVAFMASDINRPFLKFLRANHHYFVRELILRNELSIENIDLLNLLLGLNHKTINAYYEDHPFLNEGDAITRNTNFLFDIIAPVSNIEIYEYYKKLYMIKIQPSSEAEQLVKSKNYKLFINAYKKHVNGELANPHDRVTFFYRSLKAAVESDNEKVFNFLVNDKKSNDIDWTRYIFSSAINSKNKDYLIKTLDVMESEIKTYNIDLHHFSGKFTILEEAVSIGNVESLKIIEKKIAEIDPSVKWRRYILLVTNIFSNKKNKYSLLKIALRSRKLEMIKYIKERFEFDVNEILGVDDRTIFEEYLDIVLSLEKDKQKLDHDILRYFIDNETDLTKLRASHHLLVEVLLKNRKTLLLFLSGIKDFSFINLNSISEKSVSYHQLLIEFCFNRPDLEVFNKLIDMGLNPNNNSVIYNMFLHKIVKSKVLFKEDHIFKNFIEEFLKSTDHNIIESNFDVIVWSGNFYWIDYLRNRGLKLESNIKFLKSAAWILSKKDIRFSENKSILGNATFYNKIYKIIKNNKLSTEQEKLFHKYVLKIVAGSTNSTYFDFAIRNFGTPENLKDFTKNISIFLNQSHSFPINSHKESLKHRISIILKHIDKFDFTQPISDNKENALFLIRKGHFDFVKALVAKILQDENISPDSPLDINKFLNFNERSSHGELPLLSLFNSGSAAIYKYDINQKLDIVKFFVRYGADLPRHWTSSSLYVNSRHFFDKDLGLTRPEVSVKSDIKDKDLIYLFNAHSYIDYLINKGLFAGSDLTYLLIKNDPLLMKSLFNMDTTYLLDNRNLLKLADKSSVSYLNNDEDLIPFKLRFIKKKSLFSGDDRDIYSVYKGEYREIYNKYKDKAEIPFHITSILESNIINLNSLIKKIDFFIKGNTYNDKWITRDINEKMEKLKIRYKEFKSSNVKLIKALVLKEVY